MSAFILDGKKLSKSIEKSLKDRVEVVKDRLGRAPGLGVILVGEDPASKVYVSSKGKRARKCGIYTKDLHLPKDIDKEELFRKIREISSLEEIDGVLLQLPLPKGLDEFKAISSILPECDADGLTPLNQGLLLRGEKSPVPCTPKGIMKLIKEASNNNVLPKDLSGLNAVVVGRSILVGKPIGILLLEQNLTVTYCHSRTKNLEKVCKQADILVAAVGRPNMITKDFIKEGAVVIDVGINRLEDGSLVGDVKSEDALSLASSYTPVPGGVGPMTIAMLLENTVELAEAKIKN